jgi:hypothetical protein
VDILTNSTVCAKGKIVKLRGLLYTCRTKGLAHV